MSLFKVILIFTLSLVGNATFAQDLSAFGLPAVTSVEELNGETTYSLSLQILILMTALTVLPSLVLGMTAFTRIIIVLSIITFIVASKGFSVLYLFLLADLFCCSAVVTIFYGFFNKNINPKLAAYSIILGFIFASSTIWNSNLMFLQPYSWIIGAFVSALVYFLLTKD